MKRVLAYHIANAYQSASPQAKDATALNEFELL